MEGRIVEGNSKTTAAAARIAIYGSPAAINRLAEVSRRGGILADPETADSFVSA